MKKFILICLAAILCITLAGCIDESVLENAKITDESSTFAEESVTASESASTSSQDKCYLTSKTQKIDKQNAKFNTKIK